MVSQARFSKSVLVPAMAVAAAGLMALTASSAEAGWRGRYNGGAVGAGVIGGLALGAIVASAARPTYATPIEDDGPYCYKARKRLFVDG